MVEEPDDLTPEEDAALDAAWEQIKNESTNNPEPDRLPKT
jgi:hypothetical protein